MLESVRHLSFLEATLDPALFLPPLINLGVLLVFFFLLEKVSPALNPRTPRLRKEFRLDLIYKLTYTAVSSSLFRFASIPIVAFSLENLFFLWIARFLPQDFIPYQAAIAAQPTWLIVAEFMLFLEFFLYWRHRLFHTKLFWRFHAVHHAEKELSWLAASRLHPVEYLTFKLPNFLPYLVLSAANHRAFQVSIIVHALRVFWNGLAHSNIAWDFRPLHHLIVSPIFHNLHHAKAPEAQNKNFSVVFPFWDIVFGTFYLPKEKGPIVIGVEEEVPESFWGQLVYPFKRLPSDQREALPTFSSKDDPTTSAISG